MRSKIHNVVMTVVFLALAGVNSHSHGQTIECTMQRMVFSVFTYALWRDPTASERTFWVQKATDAGYKVVRKGQTICALVKEGQENERAKELITAIMDHAISDPVEPRFHTTEVSRMVDRVFQKATGKDATPQDHAVWDNLVRTQKTTAPELFARITPDLVIKEVVDVANDPKAVNVHIVNQGKFSTRSNTVLRLEINNGPGCTGKVASVAEFNVPVLKGGQEASVTVKSTERLKLSGLERLAYKLTADASKGVVELDEDNNQKCVPAYVIK